MRSVTWGTSSVPSAWRTSGSPMAPSRMASTERHSSTVSRGRSSPVRRYTAAPISARSNVKRGPWPETARSTRPASATTSGPTPSPPISAIR